MELDLATTITNILNNFDFCIEYCLKNNILPDRRQIQHCPICHHQMTYYNSCHHWKCHNNQCNTTRSMLYPFEIKTNNFQNYISSLLLFCADIPIHTCIKLFNISSQIIQRNYAHFRDILYNIYRNEMQIQNLSFHVQIDESLFGKRKYDRGRILKSQTWVFGACDDNPGGRVYMVAVEKRNEDTLLPIIQSWCPAGSIINSDCWNAYNNIPAYGFHHFTVNHSENFVVTKEHTQRIESLWHQCKLWMNNHFYNKSSETEKYIGEWCFRYNHQKDMRSILNEILNK